MQGRGRYSASVEESDGIGLSRASIESNFALRELVG